MSALLSMAATDTFRWFHELRLQGIRITDGNTGAKLVEEAGELLEAAEQFHRGKALVEAADCFIALLGAVESQGWTVDHLASAVTSKMAINRKRKWEQQDDGTYHHVKEATDGD